MAARIAVQYNDKSKYEYTKKFEKNFKIRCLNQNLQNFQYLQNYLRALHLLRTNFQPLTRRYTMRKKLYKISAASIALALAFTFGCSSSNDDDGGGSNEEWIETFAIKDLTSTSFTMVEKEGTGCQANGTLEDYIFEYPTNYTISGSTLSFGGAEFSGNSTSIIGTWNSSSVQHIEFGGFGISGIKVVFTQNTLTLTVCLGEPGVVRGIHDGVIDKIIDCSTTELKKGNETIKIRFLDGFAYTATYNGKICTRGGYSETQKKTACTQAYNKATAEGGNADEYYDEIIEKDFSDCVKDFPEWFYN